MKDIWSQSELINLLLVLIEFCEEYFVKAKVLHRDIKPQNIILSKKD